jgi:hypothetical protein
MPTLREWRHILAAGVEAALSVPETGTVFRCLPFASGRLPALPCGLIQSGGSAGPWLDTTADSELVSTACQASATFTLWLIAGDPLSEQSHDVLDDLAQRLISVGSLSACADDPANPGRFVPVVESIESPGVGDIGGRPVWWASARLVVPLHT